MNPIFANLSPETLSSIEDQLSNNEVSCDEEMVDFFIEELGLSLEQAEAAVALRSQYLQMIFLAGQGPLHVVDGLVFCPATKSVR